ncbi:hypothetical protein HRR83_005338 [Exophiala dermatitidis]|uniref:Uncharacterized protein n=1 Tax=Exophiala dermatitidis TaxID=5970 RepID=A0AAN6ETR5_EXODE|nr:hypothetical protein HRR74_005191 [Exophiala dermatitidis]KAJ4518561.1 hypothetical protein HRR73_004142 [Exophiala dermatitidis]KAJ4534063.1 hypothetical protein HRR76_006007 [Exophiala dermatitidis]KAJ4550218.1 hypothetical protein HRR77_003693 [Exophiala dermatitidis]KAJ4571537.1 hypothetical protein HRR81_005568 [Exophiala dermatitidis]
MCFHVFRNTLPSRHPDDLNFTPSLRELIWPTEARRVVKTTSGIFPRQSLSEHSEDGGSLREQSPRDSELERLKSLVRDGTLLEPPPTSDGTTETRVNINEEGGVGPTLKAFHDFRLSRQGPVSALERHYYFAKLSGFKLCTGPECQRNKEIVMKNLHGRTTWCLSLLEWTVQFLACWSTAFETSSRELQDILAGRYDMSFRLFNMMPSLREEEEDPRMSTDCLIHDMMAWWHHSRLRVKLRHCKLKGNLLAVSKSPDFVFEDEFNKTIEKAEALGICKNRLWNLVSCCPRGWQDLPALLAMLDPQDVHRAALFRHTEILDNLAQPTLSIQTQASDMHTHDACAPDLCHFSSLDSTRVGKDINAQISPVP